jgi:hypothetical protein
MSTLASPPRPRTAFVYLTGIAGCARGISAASGRAATEQDTFPLLVGTQTRVGTPSRTKSQTVEHQSSAAWLSESGGHGPVQMGHRIDARWVVSIRGFGFSQRSKPLVCGRRQGCVLPLALFSPSLRPAAPPEPSGPIATRGHFLYADRCSVNDCGRTAFRLPVQLMLPFEAKADAKLCTTWLT